MDLLPVELKQEIFLFLTYWELQHIRSIFPEVVKDPYFKKRSLPFVRFYQYGFRKCCEMGFAGAVELYTHLPLIDRVSHLKLDIFEYTKRLSHLILAAKNGHAEVVRLLFNDSYVSYNVNERDGGYTALHHAVNSEHEDVVRELLKDPGINVNRTEWHTGSTPLHFAAYDRSETLTQLLLDHPDIDPHRRNWDGIRPIDIALAEGNQAVAELLAAA